MPGINASEMLFNLKNKKIIEKNRVTIISYQHEILTQYTYCVLYIVLKFHVHVFITSIQNMLCEISEVMIKRLW